MQARNAYALVSYCEPAFRVIHLSLAMLANKSTCRMPGTYMRKGERVEKRDTTTHTTLNF